MQGNHTPHWPTPHRCFPSHSAWHHKTLQSDPTFVSSTARTLSSAHQPAKTGTAPHLSDSMPESPPRIHHTGSCSCSTSDLPRRPPGAWYAILAVHALGYAHTCQQGKLAHLDTANPVMYIDFPNGCLKLMGTLVFPRNKYMVLRPGSKDVLAEDILESMVCCFACGGVPHKVEVYHIKWRCIIDDIKSSSSITTTRTFEIMHNKQQQCILISVPGFQYIFIGRRLCFQKQCG